jgi:hypothetical protein
MTAIKYDNSDIEGGGGGKEPDPGLYPGKIVTATNRTKRNDGAKINDLEVVVDIGEEFVRLWTYIKLPGDPSYDNSRWKLRELTDAIGLPAKGSLDPKKIEGKPVMVKTKWRRDDPERAEIKNLFKPGEESLQPGEDPTEGADDYSSWSIEDLEAEIQEKGLDMPSGRKTVAKLAAVLEEAGAEGEAEGKAEGEAEPEEDEGSEFDITSVDGFEDFAEWSNDDLKEYMAENDISVSGRFSEAKARDAIIEKIQEDDGGSETAGASPEDDYDEWTDEELKQEISDRTEQGAKIEVKGRWTRDKAIAAMRADDEENPF